MDIYKLYAAISASLDAAASLDIQRDGHIVTVYGNVVVSGANALDDGASAEVSFASTSGFTSNDTKASILTLGARQGFLTTGGSSVGDNVCVCNVAIPVAAGERMYLHISVVGTITGSVHVYMYVVPLVGSARADVRRSR